MEQVIEKTEMTENEILCAVIAELNNEFKVAKNPTFARTLQSVVAKIETLKV